ncbi:MAG TPA: transporter substrate-binding domain-containing protein [Acidobacteriota bacterium]|nr:transporter substrate-binding domain-containing protein [Acidobacteriota bacterium]
MRQRLIYITLLCSFLLFQFVQPTSAQQKETLQIQPGFMDQKWTGDLDAMVTRRLIRVLTVYNKTLYFLEKDTQRGIVYDVLKVFEEELNKKLKTGNLRVHVVFIPVSRDELIPKLVNGFGDIACANLTITDQRKKLVDFTVPTVKNASEIVVTGPASPQIATLQDLSGQEVFVRKSSSYYESLLKLNEQFKRERKKEVILKPAPEELENEDLLEMLNAGLIKILVVDDHVAVFWKQVFPNIKLHQDVKLRSGADIAWAIRKDSPQLMKELNEFLPTHGKGTTFGNLTLQKYLKSTKFVKNASSDAERKKFMDLVGVFKKYSGQYNVDTLLMIAQGYQESQLNQKVKSPVGAVGIMQIMPSTAKDLKVGDVNQVEPNIHGGVKYMRFMMDQYYKNEPMTDINKALFTFASYNAGPGRIQTLRKETAKRGLNPNIWFNNVERVVSEKVGRETVTYVSNIYKYYVAYKLISEDMKEREEIKKTLKNK